MRRVGWDSAYRRLAVQLGTTIQSGLPYSFSYDSGANIEQDRIGRNVNASRRAG